MTEAGATNTRSYSPDTYSVTETLGNGDAVDSSVWDVVYAVTAMGRAR